MGLIVALALAGTAAHAIDFDFSGNFEYDNDVVQVGFTVGAPSAVTVFTSSWIAGDPPPGDLYGFDPVLSVWGSDGALLAAEDDVGSAGNADSAGKSYAYGQYDAYIDDEDYIGDFLAAGIYSVTVTQSNNYPVRPNLANGFTHDGNDNFTSAWGIPGEYFYGGWPPLPDPRSSRWELHVLNVDSAWVVPEPSTWLVLGVGGLVIARLRRRRD